MQNCLKASILSIVAALAFCPVLLPQTADKTGESKTAIATPPPDLSGVWRRSRKPPDNSRRYTIYELVMSITTDKPAMTPWAEAKFLANKPNEGPREVSSAETNDPITRCFPPGVPRIYLIRGEPMEITQIPGRVVMLFEYDHFVRQIYTDGRQHQDPAPTYMGDAVGKWEGNTLVVDTVGFNDKTWLDNDGHPHSDALHVVERIQRVNHDTLTIDTTIDDPKAFTKPWGGHATYELKPDWNIGEMVCEDNETFADMQKKAEANK
jgi:hypothetical protein